MYYRLHSSASIKDGFFCGDTHADGNYIVAENESGTFSNGYLTDYYISSASTICGGCRGNYTMTTGTWADGDNRVPHCDIGDEYGLVAGEDDE